MRITGTFHRHLADRGSADAATGQAAQLPYHLNRAMDYGLTQPQAAEVLTHLACPYLSPMIGTRARSATVRVMPVKVAE
jgi:hypothetical protein